jgi:hypothetical protein
MPTLKKFEVFRYIIRALQLWPGANPTIVIYNVTSGLARFENKNSFLYFEKTLCPATMLALYLWIKNS